MKYLFSFLIILLPIVAIAQQQQVQQLQMQQADTLNFQNTNFNKAEILLELKKENLDNRQGYLNIYLVISTVFVTLVGVGLTFMLNRERRNIGVESKKQFDKIEDTRKIFEKEWNTQLENIETEKRKIQNFEEEQQKRQELNDKYIEAQKLQLSSQNNDVQNYKNNLNQIMDDLEDTKGIDLSDCKYKLINDWRKAVNYFSVKIYKEAETEFQQLLKNYPNELNMIDISSIYRLLSVCYLFQNDKERALSFAESAVLLNPNNYLAWNNKGVALEEFPNKQKEALQCYDTSIKLSPLVDNVWYNKGSVLDDLNRKEDALYALNRCLEITPDYDLALVLKGCILFAKEDIKGSAECFNKIDPTRVQKQQLEEIQRVFKKYEQDKEYRKFLKGRDKGQNLG